VEVTIGFWWKAGDDPAVVLAGTVVVFNDATDEIGGWGRVRSTQTLKPRY
jgi:hypothetical protein